MSLSQLIRSDRFDSPSSLYYSGPSVQGGKIQKQRLLFDQAGPRSITYDRQAANSPFDFYLNKNSAVKIEFDLTMGTGYYRNGLETSDPGENVSFKLNSGNGFSKTFGLSEIGKQTIYLSKDDLKTYNNNPLFNELSFTIAQAKNSGTGYDEWAIDNVAITELFAPATPLPTPIVTTPVVNTPVVNTGPVVDNSQVTTTSTINNTTTNNVDNSINNTVSQNFNITINGDNNSLGSFGNTQFQQTGTQGADILTGNSSNADSDVFRGMAGNDTLTGFRGGDVLVGDAGNDIIRGGNGRDVLTGGTGADTLYGGFGQNTFTGEKDGSTDRLYFKSDHLAYNWIYGSAGNQDGNKIDVIGQLDSFDRIYVQGASDYQLTYGSATASIQGQSVSGIGIYADNVLEAIYTGNNLSSSQLDAMTMGVSV